MVWKLYPHPLIALTRSELSKQMRRMDSRETKKRLLKRAIGEEKSEQRNESTVEKCDNLRVAMVSDAELLNL
jgi:hypothetical protein